MMRHHPARTAWPRGLPPTCSGHRSGRAADPASPWADRSRRRTSMPATRGRDPPVPPARQRRIRPASCAVRHEAHAREAGASDTRPWPTRNGMRNVGRLAHTIKVLMYDTTGFLLMQKRLTEGKFIWPSPADGIVTISRAQMSLLVDGLDWRAAKTKPIAKPLLIV